MNAMLRYLRTHGGFFLTVSLLTFIAALCLADQPPERRAKNRPGAASSR